MTGLPEKFTEPKGFQWGSFLTGKNAAIRYGHVMPEGEPVGHMIILPGFREPIERYFEVIHEMLEKGYAIWTMDWRGQGGSDRYLKDNPHKAHSEGYEEHIDTLKQFVDTVVKKGEKPLMLMAHSMGAHISLRYLKDNPDVFDSAILTAPMMDIHTGGLSKSIARQIAKFAKAGNYLDKYVPKATNWTPEKEVFEGNHKTSDPERFKVLGALFAANEKIQIGEATYGWVYHTFQSIDILNDENFLKSIKTPILMEISKDDQIVIVPAQERAAGLLPDCTRVDIAGAKHEIWTERDELRNPWLEKVDEFLRGRLKKLGLQPKKSKINDGVCPPSPKGPGL